MTPKEKAEELVNKYLQYTPSEEEFEYPYAIKCALIAVNEILKVAPIDKYENIDSLYTPEEIGLHLFEEYWKEVKQEIENL